MSELQPLSHHIHQLRGVIAALSESQQYYGSPAVVELAKKMGFFTFECGGSVVICNANAREILQMQGTRQAVIQAAFGIKYATKDQAPAMPEGKKQETVSPPAPKPEEPKKEQATPPKGNPQKTMLDLIEEAGDFERIFELHHLLKANQQRTKAPREKVRPSLVAIFEKAVDLADCFQFVQVVHHWIMEELHRSGDSELLPQEIEHLTARVNDRDKIQPYRLQPELSAEEIERYGKMCDNC